MSQFEALADSMLVAMRDYIDDALDRKVEAIAREVTDLLERDARLGKEDLQKLRTTMTALAALEKRLEILEGRRE